MMSGSAPVTSHCWVRWSISHESTSPRSIERARRRRLELGLQPPGVVHQVGAAGREAAFLPVDAQDAVGDHDVAVKVRVAGAGVGLDADGGRVAQAADRGRGLPVSLVAGAAVADAAHQLVEGLAAGVADQFEPLLARVEGGEECGDG